MISYSTLFAQALRLLAPYCVIPLVIWVYLGGKDLDPESKTHLWAQQLSDLNETSSQAPCDFCWILDCSAAKMGIGGLKRSVATSSGHSVVLLLPPLTIEIPADII